MAPACHLGILGGIPSGVVLSPEIRPCRKGVAHTDIIAAFSLARQPSRKCSIHSSHNAYRGPIPSFCVMRQLQNKQMGEMPRKMHASMFWDRKRRGRETQGGG